MIELQGRFGGTGTVRNPEVAQCAKTVDEATTGTTARTHFPTGAVRDTQDGKPDFLECLSPLAVWRFGEYMAKASAKYGAGNWQKGIPIENYMKSIERHLLKLKMQLKYGYDMEPGVDHAAAILFNVMGLMHEEEVARLKLRKVPEQKGV